MTPKQPKYTEDINTGCWNFDGSCDTHGYGRVSFRVDGKRKHQGAHRFMYQELRGEIPAGMQLDHLCRNRKCINPSHLEIVTVAENIRRGNGGKNQRGKPKNKKIIDALVEALENLLNANPAFRSMPVGSPGSIARIAQEMAIEAEDAAKAALALAKVSQ